MILDLKRLFDIDGDSVPLEYSLNLSDVEHWGIKPFIVPIQITGRAENRAGIVTLAYNAEFSTSVPCDRCLTDITKKFSLGFKHILVTKLYNEDPNTDLVVAENGMLNLKELTEADVILELPTKHLCSENCKGICPKCGANLNIESCNCSKKEIDPRWAKLSSLLD